MMLMVLVVWLVLVRLMVTATGAVIGQRRGRVFAAGGRGHGRGARGRAGYGRQ